MAVKAAMRVHKQFLGELERAKQLDREGETVLSSLANVSQRLPLLLGRDGASQASNDQFSADSVLGVLAFSPNVRELLLQRHFAALEKSREFLSAVLRDFQELVVRLQTLLNDFFDAQNDIMMLGEGEEKAVITTLKQLEWMEDVAKMYQRELARKQRLVEGLEYHDFKRIQTMHSQWPSRSRWGNIDVEYGASLEVSCWDLVVFTRS